jgi:hypothetical protein
MLVQHPKKRTENSSAAQKNRVEKKRIVIRTNMISPATTTERTTAVEVLIVSGVIITAVNTP